MDPKRVREARVTYQKVASAVQKIVNLRIAEMSPEDRHSVLGLGREVFAEAANRAFASEARAMAADMREELSKRLPTGDESWAILNRLADAVLAALRSEAAKPSIPEGTTIH